MAYENDVYTRNEDSELAVRVVTATEGTNNSSYDDVFTRDTNGKLAVRVVGAGGGDSHNLGYFATPQALSEAYPTGEEGDYAIVGSTDTVWIWDSGTSAWVDTDTKGQVESVNGQTGAVTLGINDVAPTQTGKSGYVLGTDGFVAGWVKPEIVQVSAMPVASEDEVDNIYQYVGITDANYTSGYFYKCVSDGQDPATYSWTQTDVQPQASGLPDQTGQSGKFLTTNGTNASWSDKPLVNRATGTDSLTVLGNATTSSNAVNVGVLSHVGPFSVSIGYNSNTAANGVAVGRNSSCNKASGVAIGDGALVELGATAIGSNAKALANFSKQLGGGTNSDANTFKVANANGNFELMSADGTIPEARLADTTNATTGDVLTLDSNGNAVWQAGGGGGGSTALSLTLAAANWSNNTIMVTATGVTASNNVIVSPAPASQSAYTTAGVMCTGQAANSLTFTATTTPSSDIVVTVLIV